MRKSRDCQECGKTYTAVRQHQICCSAACNKKFNNRRMTRGAEILDWVMASRFQRKQFPYALTTIAQIASSFRAEDIAERAGRQSWGDISKSPR